MKKLLNIIKIIINILMTLVIIVGSLFILLYIIGIEPYVVETGSMEPTIQTGSLCFINKRAEYNSIKQNDIIAFKSSTGAKVTHRAINITKKGIETKGDRNDKSDGITTTQQNYLGKNICSIPKLGNVVKLIQTTTGKIVCITVIILLLLAGILMKDEKKEKKSKKQSEEK